MIGIVDYNAGNIKSVERAMDFLGAPYVLSKDPDDLKNTDRIIFPGDGDAAYSMKELRELGYYDFLREWAAAGKPLLGICIGAQIIFDYSEEGDTECLGLVPGAIRHFSNLWKEAPSIHKGYENPLKVPHMGSVADGDLTEFSHSGKLALKVPHMGWNDVKYLNGACPILDGVPEGSDFYFVHSYVIQPKDSSVIKGAAEYGVGVPSVIQSGNIFACQFHPEKSGEVGMKLLKNFIELDCHSDQRGGI